MPAVLRFGIDVQVRQLSLVHAAEAERRAPSSSATKIGPRSMNQPPSYGLCSSSIRGRYDIVSRAATKTRLTSAASAAVARRIIVVI